MPLNIRILSNYLVNKVPTAWDMLLLYGIHAFVSNEETILRGRSHRQYPSDSATPPVKLWEKC